MTHMIDVMIVGGGPAGSYCAYTLAKNGIHPVIFDPTHPREKPCGGLVSPLVQELFPLLRALPIEHCQRDRIYFIAPSGKRICVRARRGKLLGVSRLKLDQYLMKMAIEEGAQLISERVIALNRKSHSWKAKTTKQTYRAKTLVGADGVHSLVRRQLIGHLAARDRGICLGYFVKGVENEEMIIKFAPDRSGYIWLIPRAGHTSLGIGCSEIAKSHALRGELDAFVAQHFPHVAKLAKWTAAIPNVKDVKTLRIPVAGHNWMLIGDAAGHVNPISGAGILYALCDGELAAQAVIERDPSRFNTMWKKAYGLALFSAVRLRKYLYKRPILELYCRYLARAWVLEPAKKS